MVVVVVVAIHLGGGSWGLISSQPVIFYNFKNNKIFFIISKKKCKLL